MNQFWAVWFYIIQASQDHEAERWGWFGRCGCQRPNRTSCWRSHCWCCCTSVIIQHHLIRYQHHLFTYPRTSHSLKGVMYAHPAQWAKPKICTLVLVRVLESGWRTVFVEGLREAILSLPLPYRARPHLVFSSGKTSITNLSMLSMLCEWLSLCIQINHLDVLTKKDFFFFNSLIYIINGWIKHSSQCLSENGERNLTKAKGTTHGSLLAVYLFPWSYPEISSDVKRRQSANFSDVSEGKALNQSQLSVLSTQVHGRCGGANLHLYVYVDVYATFWGDM